MPPLLTHTSTPEETHYFPLIHASDKRILLHTHLGAPFIDDTRHLPSTLNLTIYSSNESDCGQNLTGLVISIDWSATMGRWTSRYLTTLVSWATGVAAVVVFLGWTQLDQDGPLLCLYISPVFIIDPDYNQGKCPLSNKASLAISLSCSVTLFQDHSYYP